MELSSEADHGISSPFVSAGFVWAVLQSVYASNRSRDITNTSLGRAVDDVCRFLLSKVSPIAGSEQYGVFGAISAFYWHTYLTELSPCQSGLESDWLPMAFEQAGLLLRNWYDLLCDFCTKKLLVPCKCEQFGTESNCIITILFHRKPVVLFQIFEYFTINNLQLCLFNWTILVQCCVLSNRTWAKPNACDW